MRTRSLILFNERVDRLDRSKLAMRMETPQYHLDYPRMMNREWVSAIGVTEDDVDAFVLNIRLLVQDGDGLSIRELSKRVYSDEGIPEELKTAFQAERSRWNDHKQRSTAISHPMKDRNFTNAELFDVLLYGGIAHANPKKDELFFLITKRGMYSTMVFATFLDSLHLFLDVVRKIRATNEQLLALWTQNEEADSASVEPET